MRCRARALRGGVTAPAGFLAAAARAAIREGTFKGPARDDLALVASTRPATAAGVFTTNQVKAAPVVWSNSVVSAGRPVRAVLLNSGNANACTGRGGAIAVQRSARAAARALDLASPSEVLVASTGVIGVALPVERLLTAVPELSRRLRPGPDASLAAARAIMTTDTRPKQRAMEVRVAGRRYRVGGMAKGAGMIHPHMATMLCVVTTDAPLTRGQAARLLSRAAERSFNSITVDGDTSTNDCVLLMANGAAAGRIPPGSAAERAVGEAIETVCLHLARAVAADGEGARKLIEVGVTGAAGEREARQVARTVASSLLVKTAVHGGDPNWGRVLAAAGRSGVRLDLAALELRIGGRLVSRGGGAPPRRSARAREAAAARHLRGRRVRLDLKVGRGRGEALALGSDLSADYVAINASYRS